jgi:hypothetical protein
MKMIGPPSPRPSPPGEGARPRLYSEGGPLPRPMAQRARRERSFLIGAFSAHPLLGERAGVRADVPLELIWP